MKLPFMPSDFGDENNKKIEIELTNGISGDVNAFIDIKIGGKLRYTEHGEPIIIECVEVTQNFNRQCYKCFFCHNIEGCGMMRCIPERRTDNKYVKFKEVKSECKLKE